MQHALVLFALALCCCCGGAPRSAPNIVSVARIPAVSKAQPKLRIFVSDGDFYTEAHSGSILQYRHGIWIEGEHGPMRVEIMGAGLDTFKVWPTTPPQSILVHNATVRVTHFATLPMFDETTLYVLITPLTWKGREKDRPLVVITVKHVANR